MMDTKQIAELTTRIIVALIENGKADCTDIEKVCKMYRAICEQIVITESELSKR
ncbi:MAG: hypothetical protein IJM47_08995 [Synergistaceae bacterium]|nr:hypothetical protein [Synergistaceae bacterium]